MLDGVLYQDAKGGGIDSDALVILCRIGVRPFLESLVYCQQHWQCFTELILHCSERIVDR